MSSSKAWAHLPNADMIDWVVKTLETDLDQWVQASREICPGIWEKAYEAAWDEVHDAIKDTVWDQFYHEFWLAVYDGHRLAAPGDAKGINTAWLVISALMTYNRADRYWSLSSEKLALLAALCNDPAAILLLPAVRTRELIEEKTVDRVSV